MNKLVRNLRKLKSDTQAATAIEYGLIAALIAVILVTAVTALGTTLSATFTTVTSAL